MTYAAASLSFIASTTLCVLLFAAPEKLAAKKIGAHASLRELDVAAAVIPRSPPRLRAHVWQNRSNAAALTTPVIGGTYARDVGRTLIDTIAAFPEERRVHGVAGLTPQQVFTTGLCEPAFVDVIEMHDGEMYEARYRAEPYTWFTSPETSLYALSSTCTNALLASGGTIAGACALEDEAAHFPPGTACRACLELDGDHARCVIDGACRLEMNREMALGTTYYDVLHATSLACAPDFTAEMLLFVEELGEDNRVPFAFEHAIEQICQWHWNPGAGEPRLFCNVAQPGVAIAIADVVAGWTEHIRRPGEQNKPYFDRMFIASEVEADGFIWDATQLLPGRVAEISVDDISIGGWGFNPQKLRADGSDPMNLDHTRAREWISSMALKTTTNINGVPIAVYNRNLCTEDQWRGPDARGRYYCKPAFFSDALLPPDPSEWSYDWGSYFFVGPPVQIEMIGGLTLGSTGLMDSSIPGGHIPEVLGTPMLADPHWENCAWPKMFEPDEMANRDALIEDFTFTSQTYRFGKDPKTDLRVVLATSWRRAFCFEPIPGL